jgi:hypothetical protein
MIKVGSVIAMLLELVVASVAVAGLPAKAPSTTAVDASGKTIGPLANAPAVDQGVLLRLAALDLNGVATPSLWYLVPIEVDGFIAIGGFQFFSNSNCAGGVGQVWVSAPPNSQPKHNSQANPYIPAIVLGNGNQASGVVGAYFPFGKPLWAADANIQTMQFIALNDVAEPCLPALVSPNQLFGLEAKTQIFEATPPFSVK